MYKDRAPSHSEPLCVCVHQNASLSLTAVTLIPLRGGGDGCWELNLACWFQKEFKRTEMWRGRVSDVRHVRCLFFHFNNTPACLFATFPPSLPDVFTISYTFLVPAPSLPSSHVLLMIFFIWQSPIDKLIIHHRCLTSAAPPPHPFSLVSSLHFADLGQTPLILYRRDGSHDCDTSIPTYQKAPSRQHLVTRITAEWLKHTGWVT